MQTNLTLRLEKQLIKLAKEHASNQGKSVSKMVADYFMLLKKSPEKQLEAMPPITKSLKGSLGNASINEADYHKYIEEKYL